MNSNFGRFTYLGLGLLCAVITTSAISAADARNPVSRAQAEATGKLTVTGRVKVDGKPAATGDVFNSSSTATTTKGSSAVVSLGKLGRVEVLPDSNMKINFSSASITGWLRTGSTSVTKAEGVAANVSTRDGEVIADANSATDFTVGIECGNTVVSVITGQVELHAKGKVTKIAAGSHGSIGTPQAGCNPSKPS